MLLAIDIGNTNTVIGIYNGSELISHFRIQSVHDRMADEYHVTLGGLFREAGLEPSTIHAAVLSSVVPALTEALHDAVARLTGRAALVVGPSVNLNVSIGIGNPAELGSDLLANAVAAYRRFGTACLVVDFGTALTFTAVSVQGVVLGASIAPGLRTAVHSLSSGTAQLPEIDLSEPQSAIGTDTVGALRAGIVLGFQGLIDHLVRAMKQEIGGEVRVVATGGLSSVMAARLPVIDVVDPWLTLDGLRIISELNHE